MILWQIVQHIFSLLSQWRCPFSHVQVQSGMQEAHESTVELGNIEGPVLRLLISAMYGNYNPESLELLVPLFVAADAHQVRTLV
jgi:hypothetical protein